MRIFYFSSNVRCTSSHLHTLHWKRNCSKARARGVTKGFTSVLYTCGWVHAKSFTSGLLKSVDDAHQTYTMNGYT